MNDGVMRIGELSRRTGVSPALLRAWELRYGLLQPARSPGGFRLYTADDEGRVRRTVALISEGLSAAEAARLAAAPPDAATAVAQPMVDDLADGLRKALDSFDTTAGHAALDRLFGTVSAEFAITDVLIPYLHDLGERWADGSITVAQEHFASNLIRGRVLGLARDWGAGNTASAVLACPPGEAHDLGLTLFGILIARRGWRVTFLGADTPFDTLDATVDSLQPTLVVLATRDANLFNRHTAAIAATAADLTVAVAAPVTGQAIRDTGARPLADDIAEAADTLIGN
jgi:DNA-binding transcriptional MerR regulator